MAPLSLDQGPELLRCSCGPDSAAEGAGLLCPAGSSASLQGLDALTLPIHTRWGGDPWARSQSGAGPPSASYGSSYGLLGGAGNCGEAGRVPRGWSGVHSRNDDCYLGPVCAQLGFPSGTSGKEPACQCRRHKRHRFDPWVGRSPGGGHGNPLQYARLENPTDRGTWWATVHGVAESGTTEAT